MSFQEKQFLKVDSNSKTILDFLERLKFKIENSLLSEQEKNSLLDFYIDFHLKKPKQGEFSDEEFKKYLFAGWVVYNS